MAKRFTDTEKWKDPWFRKLSPNSKVLWFFITENCDQAGYWKKDYDLATFFCGFEVTEDHLLTAFNNEKDRVKDFGSHVQLLDFISFQYGHLSPECRPHRPILDLLEKYQKKGYRKGIDTLEEKEMEKEKEIKGGMGGDFNQLTAFRNFWEKYPAKGRLNESLCLRLWCEIVISRDIASRIQTALEKYSAHLKANSDWGKQPLKCLNWLNEWPDWENHQEPEKEETSAERDARILAKYKK